MRKTRNTGIGSARWLGDAWVADIAAGGKASQEAARQLAEEVDYWRRVRKHTITCALVLAHSPHVHAMSAKEAAELVLSALQSIATCEELYGAEAKRFAQG